MCYDISRYVISISYLYHLGTITLVSKRRDAVVKFVVAYVDYEVR